MSSYNPANTLEDIDPRYLLPSIHPAYPRLLCAHIRNLGVEMDALFEGNSIGWDELISSTRFISFVQFRELSLRAIKLSRKDHLELDISSMIQASAHGPLGYGALAAATVRDGVLLIQRMLSTRLSILELGFEEHDEEAVFYINSLIDLKELKAFVYVMLLGSLLDVLEKTTGLVPANIKVFFPFSKPESKVFASYQARFPTAQLYFDESCLRVVLPRGLLDQPSLTADEFAYRNAVRECEQLLSSTKQGGDISKRLKEYLFENAPDFPSQGLSADHFAVSTRTLIRRLKEEETSYQSILDEVRKELAVWYLKDTQLSIDQIAERLGYVDTSNFSRVFKRWFGSKPSEFKAKQV